MNRRITEEQQSSMSLHDNTVLIQDYNNLDYSDQYQSAPSSQEHSLSRYHQQQLEKVEEIARISGKDYLNSYLHQHHQRKQTRNIPYPIRDIESKYDFGESPSTKAEISQMPRLSNSNQQRPSHSRDRSRLLNMPSLDEEPSHQDLNSNHEEKRRISSKEVYSRHRETDNSQKHAQFDIQNFLNAQPVPLKNKKGISVLAESSQPKGAKPRPISPIKPIKQEKSIVLMTLPENDASYLSEGIKWDAIRKSEEQRTQLQYAQQFRMQQVRLNFIDTFLPSTLKPKNNPYNMLKYILNKHQL